MIFHEIFRELLWKYDFAGINFRERSKDSRNRESFYPRNFLHLKYPRWTTHKTVLRWFAKSGEVPELSVFNVSEKMAIRENNPALLVNSKLRDYWCTNFWTCYQFHWFRLRKRINNVIFVMSCGLVQEEFKRVRTPDLLESAENSSRKENRSFNVFSTT